MNCKDALLGYNRLTESWRRLKAKTSASRCIAGALHGDGTALERALGRGREREGGSGVVNESGSAGLPKNSIAGTERKIKAEKRMNLEPERRSSGLHGDCTWYSLINCSNTIFLKVLQVYNSHYILFYSVTCLLI
jgi:hypothetical protein